jgi:hypothetical protein
MNEFDPLKIRVYPLANPDIISAREIVGYRNVGVFSKTYISELPPLSVELNVDKRWGDAEVELIKSATRLMIDRIDEESVRNCAKSNTTRGFPGGSGRDSIDTDFRDTLYSWLMVPCFGCDSRRLLVEKVDLGAPPGSRTLGRARLAGHIPRDPRGDLYLKVQLNSSWLNNSSADGGTDPNLWANVIAHEMLHNFRYDHGSGDDYETDYRGYFIEEFGKCIENFRIVPSPPSRGEFYTTDGSGNLSLLKKYTSFRKTWQLIVPGNFGGNGVTDLLFYDPTVGAGEIYTTDGSGNLALLKSYSSGWRKTWKLIVPGDFGGNGVTDLLFYDPTSGEGEFYTTDGSGNLSLLKKYTSFRKTWQLIVPGNFGGNGVTDLLFYDPTVGAGEIYTTDGSGNLALLKSYSSGWRKTWKLIVPGDFGGNGVTDLLFYDPTSGEGEFYTTDGSGNLSLLKKYTSFRKTWQLIVPGNFGGNGVTDLLFYDPTVGAGEIYTTDGSGNLALLKSYSSGWRKTWKLIVPGDFGGVGVTGLLFYDPTV